MSDEELESLVKTYGNNQNDIRYLEFINDANPNKGVITPDPLASKSTYMSQTQNFKGEEDMEALIFKIKAQIKKDRIRLGEFFLDHDMLRKGNVAAQKFRGVLYA